VVQESHVEVERDSLDVGLPGNYLHFLIVQPWAKSFCCSPLQIHPFNESEFLVCLGLLIGTPVCGIKGASLWQNGNAKLADSNRISIMPYPNFDHFIPENHLLHFKEFLPFIFQDNTVKVTDPWWQFSRAVKEFNR
jgi:hypothetical protein